MLEEDKSSLGAHELLYYPVGCGVQVLAAIGHDVVEVDVAERLQRFGQRRRIARSLAIGAMTDMAVRMIATKAGVSVPVDNPLRTDLVSRIAVLVRILAIVG